MGGGSGVSSARRGRLSGERGRVTPGLLMVAAALGGGAWLLLQEPDQRRELACRPAIWLTNWAQVEERHTDPFAARFNAAFRALSRMCPHTVGERVDAAAKHADKAVADAVGRTKAIANREILDVIDGERLRVFGIGEARLLGVTVSSERRFEAVAYLTKHVRGKRLAIGLDKEVDVERRPLITVTLEDETLLNAAMIRRGLARPWVSQGPWREWG